MKKLLMGVVLCLIGIALLPPSAEAADATKVKAMVGLLKYSDDGRPEILAKLKELTGIEMELMIPDEFNEEKARLALAAGDIPDIISLGGNFYVELVNEGLLLDLKPMIEKSKYVKAAVPQAMLDSVTRQGKIYGLPYQHPGGCIGYYRKDWLDKLGLHVPTTYEELVEVMRAFTFKDPDGDGKANTYGYTTLVDNSFDNYNRLVFQDAVVAFTKKNGVWVDGFLEPEMEAALGRLKALYDEGLIDPQFPTTKSTSEARAKLIEGKVGIFEYWAGEWGMNLDLYTKKVNPNNVIAGMPAPKGIRYKVRQPVLWAITVNAKDPQLIFDQIFEGFFDKGPRQTLYTYGVEGLHWTIQDGVGKFLPSKVDPKVEFKKAWLARELQLNDMEYIVPLDPRVKDSMACFTDTWQEQTPPPSETYAKYWGDTMELKKEVILKIVTGEYSIPDGLKLYHDKAMKEFKLAQILEELNKNQ